MKKLSLVALLAAITFGGVEAASARMVAMPVAAPAPTVQLGDPYLTHESEQDIEYYLGQKSPGMIVASAPCSAPCAAPCPCPMDCPTPPCTPVCCPAVRGLFDGGMCCGGRAVPPVCGC